MIVLMLIVDKKCECGKLALQVAESVNACRVEERAAENQREAALNAQVDIT